VQGFHPFWYLHYIWWLHHLLPNTSEPCVHLLFPRFGFLVLLYQIHLPRTTASLFLLFFWLVGIWPSTYLALLIIATTQYFLWSYPVGPWSQKRLEGILALPAVKLPSSRHIFSYGTGELDGIWVINYWLLAMMVHIQPWVYHCMPIHFLNHFQELHEPKSCFCHWDGSLLDLQPYIVSYSKCLCWHWMFLACCSLGVVMFGKSWRMAIALL